MFKKPKRKVDKVFIHCTAYAHQDLVGQKLVEAVRDWHIKRNFRDIGYHYLIDCEGKLLKGRNLEHIPAAQRGHNSRSIAICLDGLYDFQFNERQFFTLLNWVEDVSKEYDYAITFHGHCEVSSKLCPVFDYKHILELNNEGQRLDDYIDMSIGKNTLFITSKGDAVRFLQKILGVAVDGVFGQNTYRAVVKYQTLKDLEPDGIVGPITWSEILKED
jgi:N-acetylmuramoyl-L-alanine amidase